jgi:hypothetical protein
MLKPAYNCTQQQLYAVGRAAWQACDDRLADFTAFKAKYTALFVTGKVTAITRHAFGIKGAKRRLHYIHRHQRALIRLKDNLLQQLAPKAENCLEESAAFA